MYEIPWRCERENKFPTTYLVSKETVSKSLNKSTNLQGEMTMRLSNFRIPSAVIGLTLISGVAVLLSESITYAEPTHYVPSQLGSIARWKCYTSNDCTGRVRSFQDRHNCKRSGGHSCRDTRNGHCYKRL